MKSSLWLSCLLVPILAGCDGGPSCKNACDLDGSTRCSGVQVQTCSKQADGCLDWSAPASCPAAQVCSTSAKACIADPCGGVSANGVCASATSVSVCAVATGESMPRVLTYSCAGGEGCQVQNGKAGCVLTAACVAGATECVDANTLRTCAGGAWSSTTCTNGCSSSALGSFCSAPGTLTTFSGTAIFEARVANAGLTDWEAAPRRFYAPLFLVLSQGKNADGQTIIYDAVYTSAGSTTPGQFTIKVPQTPGPNDHLIIATAADDGAGGLSFAVANPGFSTAAQHEPGEVGTPSLWSWSWDTSALTAGQQLVITEAMGSAAANVHFNLLVAYATTYQQYQRLGPPAIVWVGLGAIWSCGACFAPFPATVFGIPFDSQVWLGADPGDQPYWSDAVSSHELGHWAMHSYGYSPGEGGPHFIGKPTFPGQAWSEGWATWFSSAVRGDPVYYDKQQGSFFWVNINSSSYSNGKSFVEPKAADGLLQLLDENEVSAMMWRLSSPDAASRSALFAALASTRMTNPAATRGYTRHQWSYDQSFNFTNVVDTGQGVPCVADFLDALDCAGFSRSALDAATVPATRYPFPSTNPICQ